MPRSLVARLTALVGVILLLAALAWVVVVYLATSATFVETQREVRVESIDGRLVEQVEQEIELVAGPRPGAAGRQFAARVGRSAALGLTAVLLVAMGATAWVLRRALAPVDHLTRAARELQAGRVPARLQSATATRELAGLIDAFNAAAVAIAETDELRKRLVADIAHELRTPVTNLKGQLEAVELGVLRPDREFLDTLRAETRLLERLVADFHELALSDTGRLRLELQDLPLGEVLSNVLGPLAEAAGAELSIEAPAELWVRADEDRLRQVLTNLTENAVCYTAGPLRLELVARPDGSDVAFEFRDNGPGIAPRDQPHIFERFYRAEPSRNRTHGGAGLGLAIVQGLLAAMGGRIRYVERPEGGATFEVRLPRGEAAGPSR